MERSSTVKPMRSRTANIFTDIQFWVPVVVLLCGLLLLRFIH
jgi:hypothetical protein